MDIIDVPLLEPRPNGHQQENWLLDPGRTWKRVGTHSPIHLPPLLEMSGALWSDNAPGTEHGINNRVAGYEAARQHYSLKFICVPNLTLHVTWRDEGPRKRVDAAFRFNDILYKLALTDPSMSGRYRNYALGKYELGEYYLTISLAEPLGPYCYKLVAAGLRTL